MAGRWVRPSVGRWLSGILVSVALVGAVSSLIGLLDPHVPVLSLLLLYILAVLPVAISPCCRWPLSGGRGWRRSRRC